MRPVSPTQMPREAGHHCQGQRCGSPAHAVPPIHASHVAAAIRVKRLIGVSRAAPATLALRPPPRRNAPCRDCGRRRLILARSRKVAGRATRAPAKRVAPRANRAIPVRQRKPPTPVPQKRPAAHVTLARRRNPAAPVTHVRLRRPAIPAIHVADAIPVPSSHPS